MPLPTLSGPQRRRIAFVVLALVLLVVAWRHVAGGSAGVAADAPAAPGTPAPLRSAAPSSGQAQGAGGRVDVVDVVGAVRRPGLVRLRDGSRVADAVRAAGGLTRRADPLLVNLAAPLSDGEQIVVAARGSPGAAAAATGSGPAAPVDLNAATPEQLDTLPGVGPVTAQKIVDYRTQHGPFTSAASLDAIPGIGPARIAELKGLVVPP